MALSRKYLSALGIEGDKLDEIIDAHAQTVNALKEERDTYKAKAEGLKVQANRIPELEQKIADFEAEKSGENVWETKYNELKSEFETYKSDVENKELVSAKEKAYKKLLLSANVSDKRIDAIMRISNLDEIELDDKGEIKGADKLTENIKSEWADFIVETDVKGAQTATPPANNGREGATGKSRAKQIAEQYHAELYGSNNANATKEG